MLIISLTTHELKSLEQILLNKSKYNHEINRRKLELSAIRQSETPEIKTHSTSSQVENLVIKYMSDPYIATRTLWLESIDKLEQGLDDQCKVVYDYKFNQYKYLSWLDIGKQLHYTKSTIYRMRYDILDKFNSYIGMY